MIDGNQRCGNNSDLYCACSKRLRWLAIYNEMYENQALARLYGATES